MNSATFKFNPITSTDLYHMLQMKNEKIYRNTKLGIMPILSILCICKEPDWAIIASNKSLVRIRQFSALISPINSSVVDILHW